MTNLFTRCLHALMAIGFIVAYLTAESERWRTLHTWAGYGVAGVLLVRLIYGSGVSSAPKMLHLSTLWRKISGWRTAWERAKQHGQWSPLLHSLMGGLVLIILFSLIPLTLSGWVTYMEWLPNGMAYGDEAQEMLAEVHEFLGNWTLIAILGHLAAVGGLSVLLKRNHAKVMWGWGK